MTDEPLPAALFVDFDNVFGSLHATDSRAADRFATKPDEWLRYFEEGRHLTATPRARPRQILLRRCYLNPDGVWPHNGTPVRYGSFRKHFANAAFSVADCPSLTKSGKSAADTVMIIDILDALRHETRFSEFIIMSGDADFTPVLLRLRAHDRRVTVVAQQAIAKAYRSAADIIVPHDVFAIQALGLSELVKPAPAKAAPAAAPAKSAEPAKPPEPPPIVHDILRTVRDILRERGGDVELSHLGTEARKRLPQLGKAKWPYGGFLALLTKSEDPHIQTRPGRTSGIYYAFDPDPPPPEPPPPETPEQALLSDILRVVRTLLEDGKREIHLPQLSKAVRTQLPAVVERGWPGARSLREILLRSADSGIGLRLEGPRNTPYVYDTALTAPAVTPETQAPADDALLNAVAAAVRERVTERDWFNVPDLAKAVYQSFPQFSESEKTQPWFGHASGRALIKDLVRRAPGLLLSDKGNRVYAAAGNERLRREILAMIRTILTEEGGQTPLRGLSSKLHQRVPGLRDRGLPGRVNLQTLLETSDDDRIRLRTEGEAAALIVYDPVVTALDAAQQDLFAPMEAGITAPALAS